GSMPPREARSSQPPPNQPMPPHMAQRGPNMPPVSPAGYPVMDAQMRDQLASGATVFPSGRGSSGTHDAAAPPGPYPGQGDWSAAGGPPVRTMPPWMLAVLFVGALGGALLVTILIAMAVR
ncbi:MAG TPA: hypothetical protein VK932_16975, partial [Kofleriaceae bacterium]|nr:hypothetical protein [Kofleriaceae bacterium]